MSIIIPAGIDTDKVRVPLQFPLRQDADTVVDADGKIVFTMDNSVAVGESIKFCKLFAKAPEMFELLGACYMALAIVASNTEGMNHGQDDEQDRENCLLCRLEYVLNAIK